MATWDYSIYDVSGLSHDDAWKKLRDLPLPPVSDQLATYYQQRVAQSAHFEDVETLIANNRDDDDEDDDEEAHGHPSRTKFGLLSPSPSPIFDTPATSINENKGPLHNAEAMSSSTSPSHPILQVRPPSPEPIPKALNSRNSSLPRRLSSPRKVRRLSPAMTTRSRSTLYTSFFALNSKGKPESAPPANSTPSTLISTSRSTRIRKIAKKKVGKSRRRAP